MKNTNKKEKLLRIFTVLLICFTFIRQGYAQTEKTITGKVSDTNGEVVIGAIVSIQGTSLATITDLNGQFSLRVPVNITPPPLFI
jgi:hypothetical protein